MLVDIGALISLLGFSCTYSHANDEQSAVGLFYNGNNPQDLRSGYGISDFDRKHLMISLTPSTDSDIDAADFLEKSVEVEIFSSKAKTVRSRIDNRFANG